jgi:hypothetical protein
MLGVASLTNLVTCRSASWGVAVALAWLLPGSGSNWSLWLTEAVLVWAPGLATVARISRVCASAGVTVPTNHTPVALLYVP